MIQMAERQGAHRQAMERKFLNFNGVSQILGTVFAGAVAVGSVAGGIYLLSTGHSLAEFAATLVPLAAIVWAFRWTRNRQQIEVSHKVQVTAKRK